jgi:YHS domain-containing protein
MNLCNKPSSAGVEDGLLLKRRRWENMTVVKDPVCDMECEEEEAVATSVYKGKTYYFCAIGCKNEFDQNPEMYAKQE